MARIFVALPVAEELRKSLASLPRSEAPTWRWVQPSHFHITLKFLGEIEEARVGDVRDGVHEAVASWSHSAPLGPLGSLRQPGSLGPIRLRATGVGAFPRLDAARVIWVGLAGQTDTLHRLQKAIEESLAVRGFPRETRPFRAHLTIARPRAVAPFPPGLRRYLDYDFGTWDVTSVQVMQSELFPTGPRYTVRHEIPLDARP